MSDTSVREPKKQSLLAKIRGAWSTFCSEHVALARIVIALVVAALLWLVLWFILFSGLSSSADFIYAQF